MAKPVNPSPSVNLLLKYDGALQFKKAFVNDVELSFFGGKARFGVAPNKEYTLRWDVMGFKGTKWSYTLSSETTGFAIDPASLTSPGRKFQLEKSSERRTSSFKVVKAPEGEEQ